MTRAIDLEAELFDAVDRLAEAERDRLIAAGVHPMDIAFGMVGVERVAIESGDRPPNSGPFGMLV